MNTLYRMICVLLLAAFAVNARAACEYDNGVGSNEVVGTLLGAALGGLVGSQIGSGSGRKVAIGAGVVAGGLIGNRIGDSLDCRDRDYHYSTTQNTLEHKSTGSTGAWRNPDSGHSGTVTPTRTYIANDGTPCRQFKQTIFVDGQEEQIDATACRQQDGTWQIVEG